MQNSPIAHRRVLDCAYTDIDTLYQEFHIPEQGYNEKQAEESRLQYGRNVLSGKASDTILYRLRRAFISPFTIILFVLAAVSFLTDVVLASNFSRNITSTVMILCMLLFSGIVRFTQELRAKRIADHLTQMVSSTVLVLRNGIWLRLPSEDLVVGDRVRLIVGERVPADIRLTEAKDLFLSQSVLTGGKRDPRERSPSPCPRTGPVLFRLPQHRVHGFFDHRRHRGRHRAGRGKRYGLWRLFVGSRTAQERV